MDEDTATTLKSDWSEFLHDSKDFEDVIIVAVLGSSTLHEKMIVLKKPLFEQSLRYNERMGAFGVTDGDFSHDCFVFKVFDGVIQLPYLDIFIIHRGYLLREGIWGADEELSNRGSPRVIIYGYDGLPMQSVAPPLPDYIPGLEEPQAPSVSQDEDEREHMFIQPHDPDYMLKPMYHEYIPLEDEHVLPAKEQLLPHVVSPTAESPGYVVESDPKEDPGEYEDDEDDTDDEEEDEEDEDEEEEHLASADSVVVVPTVEPVFPHEGTKPRQRLRDFLPMPTPPPSTLTSPSPPSAGDRLARCTAPSVHSSPPPVPSPLLPSSGRPTQIQTPRIASNQALIDAVTAALPSPPLPPSLYIPLPVDRRDDVPEYELPPRKRSCLSTLCPRYEIGESSTARPIGGRGINYGFVSTLDAESLQCSMSMILEDAQDSRTRISQRVTMDSQRVDLLMEDMIAHQETILIMEEEAYVSREAWAHSIGLSHAVHFELQTHREQTQHHVHKTRFQMQQAEMAKLRETDRRRQAHMLETLRVMRDMRREMGDMQAELLALREQRRRAGQPGSDARVPDHQDASRDADSHI
nr:hypothetical protein [Tanacetum cinerariifolium]